MAKTDMSISFKGKTYHVPEGYTAEDFAEHLRSVHPEAANAKLVNDGGGKWTLKEQVGTKA